MVEIWRFCGACGYVGPTKLKRCSVCAQREQKPGPPLSVLPIPPDALRAAHSTGGLQAVFDMLADVFQVTPDTLWALFESFGDDVFAGADFTITRSDQSRLTMSTIKEAYVSLGFRWDEK